MMTRESDDEEGEKECDASCCLSLVLFPRVSSPRNRVGVEYPLSDDVVGGDARGD